MLPAGDQDEVELVMCLGWLCVWAEGYWFNIPQSSAPEDGRNYRPKHVELIEIINKIIIIVASSWLFILLHH